MLRRLSVLTLALGAAVPAAAQYDDPYSPDLEPLVSQLPPGTFRKAPVRLVYDHVTRGFTLFDAAGEVAETWDRADGPALAEVPTDRPVVLEVRNANALVYDYELSALVRQEREPPVSCSGQGRQFLLAGTTTLAQSLTSAAPGDATRPDFSTSGIASLLGLSPASLLATIGQRSAGERVQASAVPAALSAGRSALAEIRDVRLDVSQAREATAAALGRAAERGDVEPIGPLLDGVRAAMERALRTPSAADDVDLRDPARVPVEVAQLTEAPSRRLQPLAEVADAIRRDRLAGTLVPAIEAQVFQLLAEVEGATDSLAQATRELQDLAITLAEAHENTRQRVLLRPDYNLREVKIEIEEDPVVEGVRGTRAGEVLAFLEPARRRGFECSVVVSLAFATPVPRYQSINDLVVDTAEEGLATTPAVLFELAPPHIGSVLGAVAGVGLGRDFTPDLYAGASFRLFDPILITGGAVWRRYDRLPDGLAVGDLLADTPYEDGFAFEEALDGGWTRTFFIGLSIKP